MKFKAKFLNILGNKYLIILFVMYNLDVSGQEPKIYRNIDSAIFSNDKAITFILYNNEIPEKLYSLSNLKELIFTRDVDSIPDDLYKIKSLKSLEIHSCNVNDLPESICEIEALESIAIYDAPIKHIPSNIGNLRNLSFLSISCDSLKSLPSSIFELPKLKYLSVKEYPNNSTFTEQYINSLIKKFPYAKIRFKPKQIKKADKDGIYLSLESALKNPDKVIQLHIRGWREAFPKEVYLLKNLKVLDISHSTFTTIPEDFDKLDRLIQFIGEMCSLEYLPDCIGNIKTLQKITIVNSPLKGIPKSIGNLEHLTDLILWGCPISELPESIYKLQNLKELRFYHPLISKHKFTEEQQIEIKKKLPNCKVMF